MANCMKCSSYIDGWVDMVMLKDDLWLSIANKKDILCSSCIEKTLKRKITINDFKPNSDGTMLPCNISFALCNNLI